MAVPAASLVAADDRSATSVGGPLPTIALVAACLVVLNAGVQILPDAPLVADVPVVSTILTTQRVLVLLGLACLVLARPRPSTFATPLDIPLIALVALAGFSSLQADQSLTTWRGLATAVAVMYLIVGVLRTHPDAVPALLTCVLGAALVAAAIAVEQFAKGTDTFFYRDLTGGNVEVNCGSCVVRATGTFTNPNLLAGFLIMAVPLVVGLLATDSLRRARVAWYVLVGICVLGLVVTFSRAASLALAMVGLAAIVAWLLIRRAPQGVRVPTFVAAGLVGTVALLAVLATGALARVGGRSALWEAALDAAVRGGIDGVGYGRAGDVMRAQSGVTYAHTHNLWLNWLVDVGPLGPVLITAVLGIAVVCGLRRAIAGSLVAAGGAAAVLAILVASLTDHPTAIARNLLLLFVAVACSVAGSLTPGAAAGRHLIYGTKTLGLPETPGPVHSDSAQRSGQRGAAPPPLAQQPLSPPALVPQASAPQSFAPHPSAPQEMAPHPSALQESATQPPAVRSAVPQPSLLPSLVPSVRAPAAPAVVPPVVTPPMVSQPRISQPSVTQQPLTQPAGAPPAGGSAWQPLERRADEWARLPRRPAADPLADVGSARVPIVPFGPPADPGAVTAAIAPVNRYGNPLGDYYSDSYDRLDPDDDDPYGVGYAVGPDERTYRLVDDEATDPTRGDPPPREQTSLETRRGRRDTR